MIGRVVGLSGVARGARDAQAAGREAELGGVIGVALAMVVVSRRIAAADRAQDRGSVELVGEDEAPIAVSRSEERPSEADLAPFPARSHNCEEVRHM